ncbi:MAG: hypothetical protein FWD69_11465 [Polyangiaceae bacterium]|nr:hypothetical protein [Polyangiaceae bacterium]
MPEVNVLVAVTAVVVVGLVVWVAAVLLTAKEPWARPATPAPKPGDVDGDVSASSSDRGDA